jgi:hypothetical protein
VKGQGQSFYLSSPVELKGSNLDFCFSVRNSIALLREEELKRDLVSSLQVILVVLVTSDLTLSAFD